MPSPTAISDPFPLARRRTSSSAPYLSPSRAHFRPRRRSSTMTTATTFSSARDGESLDEMDEDEDADGDVEEWEGGAGAEYVSGSGSPRAPGAKGGKRGTKKKDEPMSPLSVVLYVVFFYLIWQLLTRSTDTEILSHVSPASPAYAHLFSHSPELPGSSAGGMSGSGSGHYLPYHIPHIPSPLPPSGSGSGNSPAGSPHAAPSTPRLVLGIAMYPFYLLITLLAVPLPLLLNAAHLILSLAAAIVYPLTSTAHILAMTFIVAPAQAARAVLLVFYPVYVFVGGVVGAGCVMGLGIGWAGRRGAEWAFGKSRKGKKRASRSAGPGSGLGLRVDPNAPSATTTRTRTRTHRA